MVAKSNNFGNYTVMLNDSRDDLIDHINKNSKYMGGYSITNNTGNTLYLRYTDREVIITMGPDAVAEAFRDKPDEAESRQSPIKRIFKRVFGNG